MAVLITAARQPAVLGADTCRQLFMLKKGRGMKPDNCRPDAIRLARSTHQQAVGAVDGHAARKRVVDGQVTYVGGWVVAPALVHVSIHVEVHWVVAHGLLAHVLKLHPLHVHGFESTLHLVEGQGITTLIGISVPRCVCVYLTICASVCVQV